MNKPKKIGTAAESAVVKFLQPNGFAHAERRSLRGALDAGDITGTPGVAWEVKGGDAARRASDLLIETWMAELTTEVANARADEGVLVLQRAGVGPANAGRWWAFMPAHQFACLTAVGATPRRMALGLDFPVRMLLADAVSLLRTAGYGDEPELPTPRPMLDYLACTTPDHPGHGGWCPTCHWDGTPEQVAPECSTSQPQMHADCDGCDCRCHAELPAAVA